MGIEHREFTRVPAHVWGVVAPGSDAETVYEVEQLSIRGGHAVTDERLDIGTTLSLQLTNDLAPEALSIPVEAIVRNHDGTGMGLEFTSMPLESYEHLQRLVELYAPDPDRVMKEIHEHVGLKSASRESDAA